MNELNASENLGSHPESAVATTEEPVVKTLEQQRLDLRLRLQLNRRFLAHKLLDREQESYFPRSATMRFLSRQSTHQIIHKAANAALGLQTFRTLRFGYKAAKFVRSLFSHDKTSSELRV